MLYNVMSAPWSILTRGTHCTKTLRYIMKATMQILQLILLAGREVF